VTSVRDLMSVSLSAQLTTWPIVAYVFQSFSAVGVIANLIVVPVLPIVMMFGVGFILFGWAHPFLSSLFVWPAWVVLKGSYAVLEYLASIPYVAVSTSLVNVWVMIIYYIALVSIFFMLGAQKLINEPAS
jgi:competence protein ComEC